MRDTSRLEDVSYSLDVATCCLGIRTNPMRFVYQGLGDIRLHTWQAHVEASAEEITAVPAPAMHKIKSVGTDTRIANATVVGSYQRQKRAISIHWCQPAGLIIIYGDDSSGTLSLPV
jgi:hypothetical protein